MRYLILAANEADAIECARARVARGLEADSHYTLIWPGRTDRAAGQLFDRLIVTALFPVHPGADRIRAAAECLIRKVDA